MSQAEVMWVQGLLNKLRAAVAIQNKEDTDDKQADS